MTDRKPFNLVAAVFAAGFPPLPLKVAPTTDAGLTDDFNETVEFRLSGRLDDLTSASTDADSLVDNLTEANKGAPAVLSHALLPLIARAAALRADIAALAEAVRTDAGEAL